MRGLVEELLWLLGNLLALEEHYVDTVQDAKGYVAARMMRAYVQQLLEKAAGQEWRPRWCEVKHLLLVAVHSLECASALVAAKGAEEEAMKEVEGLLEAAREAFSRAKGVVVREQGQ